LQVGRQMAVMQKSAGGRWLVVPRLSNRANSLSTQVRKVRNRASNIGREEPHPDHRAAESAQDHRANRIA